MKTIVIIAGTLSLLGAASAQWRPDTAMVSSVSGQFFVSVRGGSLSAQSKQFAIGPNMVTLEPALLAVSCERIKQELLRELDMPDRFRGKILMILRPAGSADDPITIVPQRFAGNWNCAVELPDAVDRNRFVETVVRACLLEIANRNSTDHSTEIPEWLARGFARQLLGSGEIRLILPPPNTMENGLSIARVNVDFTDSPYASGRSTRKLNPLAEAMETLHANPPLSFEELSWPNEEQLSGGAVKVYGSSAQLFVVQLLRLKNGPEDLQAMLAKLPDYLNWQLAFLDAFHGRFSKQLDVEKWWALEVVQFTGRDLQHLWTHEESWRRLDALFRFPIEVKIGEADPMRTDITFQTIIRGWSRTQQLQALKKRMWELDLARLRISQDFVPLVDDYRQVLQDYYKKRIASARMLRQTGPIPDKAVEEAVEQLDNLDVRRAALRLAPQAPIAAAAETMASPAR